MSKLCELQPMLSFIITMMDGALKVKNINYRKVNLYITKSGSNVDQPKITSGAFLTYMGQRRHTILFQPFE